MGYVKNLKLCMHIPKMLTWRNRYATWYNLSTESLNVFLLLYEIFSFQHNHSRFICRRKHFIGVSKALLNIYDGPFLTMQWTNKGYCLYLQKNSIKYVWQGSKFTLHFSASPSFTMRRKLFTHEVLNHRLP